MTPKQIDAFCTNLPGAVRSIQWKGVIVFKLGGTLFAMMSSYDQGQKRELWFKADPAHYETLSRSRGFSPARRPRLQWVAMNDPKALTDAQLKAYLKRAHAVVASTLSRKKQAELGL
jgi:predicted DNA-binding protein (MmcQ/YjbR family)